MHTILFDLDGTLLSMDMSRFEKLYFTALSETFTDIPDIATHILASTEVMVRNTQPITNETIFFEDFTQRIHMNTEDIVPRFMDFYRNQFDRVKASIVHDRPLVETVHSLKAAGYRVVLATNPLFPKEVQLKRLGWAGFSPEDFDHITTFEECCYLKPQPEYYQEILETISCAPEDCLMVGNDALEDMVAGRLGISTYLITDHLLNRHNVPLTANHSGSYEDFKDFANTLIQKPTR